MNWQEYWNQLARDHTNHHAQVARFMGEKPVNDQIIDDIAGHIAAMLDLKPDQQLLDVCCGNGVITQKLAEKCLQVVGVDISEEQLSAAGQKAISENIVYQYGDVIDLTDYVRGEFDKISMYFSFQYLDSYRKGKKAISQMIQLLRPGGEIFIGDVPDYDRLANFYPSSWDRFKYHTNQLLGRSLMGKFWKESEIHSICENLGIRYAKMEQPRHLPYAGYRVDYLIWKPVTG